MVFGEGVEKTALRFSSLQQPEGLRAFLVYYELTVSKFTSPALRRTGKAPSGQGVFRTDPDIAWTIKGNVLGCGKDAEYLEVRLKFPAGNWGGGSKPAETQNSSF